MKWNESQTHGLESPKEIQGKNTGEKVVELMDEPGPVKSLGEPAIRNLNMERMEHGGVVVDQDKDIREG